MGSADLFTLSPAMHDYLAQNLPALTRRHGLQKGLFEALYRQADLRLDYDASQTRPAAQTFALRRGNCLSLVLMTAAFARELGLALSFQIADIEQQARRQDDSLVLLSDHINITLGRRIVDRNVPGEWTSLTIDFLPPEQLRGMRSHRVEEAEVVAMYLNNRAAEALARGELANAYAWAKAAARQLPGHASAYNTLGVVYRRQGLAALATRAFRHTLALAPGHLPAMNNLASVLQASGALAEAAEWRARLAALEPHPPFHFLQLGREALARGDARQARDWFERELRRDDSSAELYFWLAQAQHRLGQPAAAARALGRAAELGTTPAERQRYAGKLAWLREQAQRQ